MTDEEFVNSVRQQISQRPLGYIRALANGSTIIKVLIDSGNLAGNLISDTLATSLGLKMNPVNLRFGGADTSTMIQVIGETEPFKLKFENLNKILVIKSFVCVGLSHCLNLGFSFLTESGASLDFSRQKAKLVLANTSIPLLPRNFQLGYPSVDKNFQEVLQKINTDQIAKFSFVDVARLQGRRDHLIGHILSSVSRVSCVTEQKLSENSVNIVTVPVPHIKDSQVYFSTDVATSDLLENNILPLDGIYKVDKIHGQQVCKIQVYNLNSDPKIVQNCVLGTIHKYEEHEPQLTVAALNHTHQTKASLKEEGKRRKFIQDNVQLEGNELLTAKQKDQLVDLLLEHFDALAVDSNDFGHTDLIQFKIKLKPDAVPIRARTRPLNPTQEKDLKRQIQEWIEADIIEPADGEWASALVPCKKKNSDKLRWCIDYRHLNLATMKDSYPIPHLSSNLERLKGGKIFSSLDAPGAYHSIEVESESRPYTAFTSVYGLYQFKRLPFGVSNGPSCYSRLVARALERLPPGFTMAYLDDILIYSKTVEDHFEHLKSVLDLHVQYGLKLNLKKCNLFQTKVVYLGHQVSQHGIEMVPEYVQKIQDWPLPKTGAELRTFLGFLGYYRDFIKDFTVLTANLNSLRAMKGNIVLKETDIEKISVLKKKFLEAPIRAFPDFENASPFILETDWSCIGIAAVLKQNQEGKERLIACLSRSCSKSERNYPSWKGETLAIVFGCKKLEHILSYRKFEVRTDSSFNTFLNSTKEARGMIYRWIMYLQNFSFDVIYVRGQQNAADPISRVSWPLDETIDDLDLKDNLDDLQEVAAVVTSQNQKFLMAQAMDPAISMILGILKNTKTKTEMVQKLKLCGPTAIMYIKDINRLSIQEGLLILRKGTQTKVCVPRSMVLDMLNWGHIGHRGVNALTNQLTNYFWPKMHDDIKQYVASCNVCAQKSNVPKKLRYAFHKEILGRVNLRVYIDFCGPLLTNRVCSRNYRYLLTILDHFSKYLVVVPCETMTAREAVEGFVEHYVLKFGVPQTLHSDQGTHFVNKIFTEMCSLLDCSKTGTLAYNPEGNAYLERSHGSFKPILNALGKENWVKNLPMVVFTYNISRNSSTGFSPFELFFGRMVDIPIQTIFPFPRQHDETYFEYVQRLRTRFEELGRKVVDKQLQLRMNHEGNSIHALSKLKVGNKVYFLDPKTRTNKLKKEHVWSGPWQIIERLNFFTLKILNLKTEEIRVTNVRNVRPYTSRSLLYEKYDVQGQRPIHDDSDICWSDREEGGDMDSASIISDGEGEFSTALSSMSDGRMSEASEKETVLLSDCDDNVDTGDPNMEHRDQSSITQANSRTMDDLRRSDRHALASARERITGLYNDKLV